MVLSPDGSLVAACFDDFTVRLWSTANGKLIKTFEGHTDEVWSVQFSPDGKRLVWNVHTESESPVLALVGHTDQTVSAVYSHTQDVIATASVDCLIMLWDAETGQHLHTLRGHHYPLSSLLFTPDDTQLISTANDSAKIWDISSGQEVAALKGHTEMIWCLAVSHTGGRIATDSEDSSCRIWDAKTGEELVTLAEHTAAVSSVAWSPDDQVVISASADCTVAICDSYHGELKHLLQHEAGVKTVACSPTGELVCSGAEDGWVRLWSARSGNLIAGYRGGERVISRVKFSPNGRDIFYTSEDSLIRGWNVSDAVRLYI